MKLKYSLPEKVERDIILLAKECKIKKVILFGSRARGDNHQRSDVDLAVCGGDTDRFKCEIDEKAETLLMFDVVQLDREIQPELLSAIEKEGVKIYEEI